MRPSVALLIGLAFAVFSAGCRSNSALVESQLRQRDGQVRDLRDEVDRCGAYNQALEQELRNLRGDGLAADSPERGQPGYPVRSLSLGRGTGGRDDHGLPGDEALEVLIEPRDPEGNVTRVPGTAIIQVVEIGSDGIKRPLSSWDITSDQLKHSWKSGLLTTGYDLILPWKVWPSTEKLRITAQFRLADGRLFEADRDVNVRVSPVNQRPTRGPVIVPSPDPVLPPPTVEPPAPAGPNLTGSAGTKTAPMPKGGEAAGKPPVKPVAELLRPIPLIVPTASVKPGSSSSGQTLPAN
jgi:hypothetical protein